MIAIPDFAYGLYLLLSFLSLKFMEFENLTIRCHGKLGTNHLQVNITYSWVKVAVIFVFTFNL